MSRDKETPYYSPKDLGLDPFEMWLVSLIESAARHRKFTLVAAFVGLLAIGSIKYYLETQPEALEKERPVMAATHESEATSKMVDDPTRAAVRTIIESNLIPLERETIGATFDIVTTPPVNLQAIADCGIRRVDFNKPGALLTLLAADCERKPAEKGWDYAQEIPGTFHTFIVFVNRQTGEANRIVTVDMGRSELFNAFDGNNRLVAFKTLHGQSITAQELFSQASSPVKLQNTRNFINL